MKNVLLIGLGRFGRHIAKKLYELNHQVMAIDLNENRIDDILPYVTSAQIGDCTNEKFLKTLGIRNYDVCIVSIGNDFQNCLEITSFLKDLGATMVVSRASRDIEEKLLLANGADEVVYPERQLATWTAIRYTANHILDYIELDRTHGIFELSIPPEWDGKNVGQLDIRKKYQINILGLKHGENMNLAISSDTLLNSEDTMLVLGEIKAIHKCFHI